MPENIINISISGTDKESFAYKKICWDIVAMLRSQGIAVNVDGTDAGKLEVNESNVFSAEQLENLNKGGPAYRSAVLNKGFVGTQEEWFKSLADSRNQIEKTTQQFFDSNKEESPKLYIVWNQEKTLAVVTNDRQLAYEARKGADTNCAFENGTQCATAVGFVEDTGDENCTMEELVSFETSPI